jgi:branched-chain amino acid transport system substrate-binding protein
LGGLAVGDKKQRVELVVYDDKFKSDETITAVNRLVFDDKVHYIIGPMGTAPALAATPITEKNKVLVMTMAFGPKAINAEKPFSFRPSLTPSETSQALINWTVRNKSVKKVGALLPNDETGQQVARDLEAAYKAAGAQLAVREFFERDRLDMVPLITRIIAFGVEAIDLDGLAPTTAGLIVKQARELGFKGTFIRTGGPATQEIINVAGVQAAEGMTAVAFVDPASPSIKAYAERYRKKYNKEMNGFSPAFYDGTHMLLAAISKVGNPANTEAVRNALEATKDYNGIVGTVNWTGKEAYGINHQVSAPFLISEVKDGKEVIRARCVQTECK